MTYRRYRSIPPWRRVAAFLALLVLSVSAAAAARADDPGTLGRPDRIEHGVSIGGTPVGGLTADEATAAVHAAFERPLALTIARRTRDIPAARLGAIPLLTPALEEALGAPPGTAVSLEVLVDRPRLEAAAESLAHKYSRPAVDAEIELRDLRPSVSKERAGLEIQTRALARRLESALRSGQRGPVVAPQTILRPDVTRADAWPVVVIRRDANRLFLYTSPKKRVEFGVATGQPTYPTPLGRFTIVSKQMHPWWYPPDSDWARGLSPVPPGPGNPLGTRWMGLTAPGVGIHGTPDAASIGYSTSHGCIRMQIPDAEWLFEHVDEGTSVFIV
jgi:L,D-transpeptidase catalytic domain/Putative peptidoglycan binding domain